MHIHIHIYVHIIYMYYLKLWIYKYHCFLWSHLSMTQINWNYPRLKSIQDLVAGRTKSLWLFLFWATIPILILSPQLGFTNQSIKKESKSINQPLEPSGSFTPILCYCEVCHWEWTKATWSTVKIRHHQLGSRTLPPNIMLQWNSISLFPCQLGWCSTCMIIGCKDMPSPKHHQLRLSRSTDHLNQPYLKIEQMQHYPSCELEAVIWWHKIQPVLLCAWTKPHPPESKNLHHTVDGRNPAPVDR